MKQKCVLSYKCKQVDSAIPLIGIYPRKVKKQTETLHLHEDICSCYSSVEFSSVTQSCQTLCDPMDYSTPGLPVHHQLPELTQTHAH